MPTEPRRFRGLARRDLLGFTVPVASTWRSRVIGLALLDRDRAGDGLLIPRCRSLHTFGMRFAIDILFLDAAGRVIELRRAVPPRRVMHCRRARDVLELPTPDIL